ncbi:MAG: NAD(P)-binding domain-containing protein [Phycisphaerales bacterium]|nr:NAD(P)-binding domain-containing protein [Phycisphaerales bacterium]
MHDAAIIGAGPIGLEVHAALRREGLRCLHLDAGPVGATFQWWAPGTRFFSSPERIGICGIPLVTVGGEKATREEYLAYLRSVAQQLGLPVRTYERVDAIAALAGGGFTLRASTTAGTGAAHSARRVIFAIGDMHRPRLLGVPGEDLPHVSHYLAEPHRYFRRRVLIVGGRNSAVEAAIRLHRTGAAVTISYRRPAIDPARIKYWLMPELRDLIGSGAVAFHPLTIPVGIGPGGVTLARCPDDRALPSRAADRFEVAADDVLLLTGYTMDTAMLEAAGVAISGPRRAPEFNPATMETNVPGLYVAGTATAGTQERHRVFIENCHTHAARIAAAVLGRVADAPDEVLTMPEA